MFTIEPKMLCIFWSTQTNLIVTSICLVFLTTRLVIYHLNMGVQLRRVPTQGPHTFQLLRVREILQFFWALALARHVFAAIVDILKPRRTYPPLTKENGDWNFSLPLGEDSSNQSPQLTLLARWYTCILSQHDWIFLMKDQLEITPQQKIVN